MSDGHPAAAVEWTFPARPEFVGEARAVVGAWARERGVEDDVVDAVLLCLSEAATNAVVHAYVGREPGDVRVVAESLTDAVCVRVVDDGLGMRPRADSPGLGLGLPTMAQLTTDLDIREGAQGRGTDIRMTFEAPGIHGPMWPLSPDERRTLMTRLTRVTHDGSWPDVGVGRLPDVLVPVMADACALDVVDGAGVPSRVAGRIRGERSEADSTRLGSLRPRVETPASATRATRDDHRPHQVELTPERIRAITYDDRDAAWMTATGIRWWVVLPMLVGGGELVGLLHFGARPDRGPFPDDAVAFMGTIAERAAHGLANSRLIAELRKASERLEHILGAVSEAILVQNRALEVVYANDACAQLLGLRSGREVVGAPPRLLFDQLEVMTEDGTPLTLDDLPGRRLLLGRPSGALVCRVRERATGREHRWLLRARSAADGELAVTVFEDLDAQERRP